MAREQLPLSPRLVCSKFTVSIVALTRKAVARAITPGIEWNRWNGIEWNRWNRIEWSGWNKIE